MTTNKSISAQIKDLPAYQRGEVFTAQQVVSALGVSVNTVSGALGSLVDRCDLHRTGDGGYYRPKRHPVHRKWDSDMWKPKPKGPWREAHGDEVY